MNINQAYKNADLQHQTWKKKEFSIYKCLLNLFALSSNGDGLVVKKKDHFYVSPFYSLLPNLLLC